MFNISVKMLTLYRVAQKTGTPFLYILSAYALLNFIIY